MTVNIDKKKLSNIIYKRLDKTVSRDSIYDAIGVINEFMIQAIINNEAISINNFGTLSPAMFHGHRGFNIASGQMQQVPEFRTVKFRAHDAFLQLLETRKRKFRKA